MTTTRAHAPVVTAFPPTLAPSARLQNGYLLVDPGALPGGLPITTFAASTCIPTNWGTDLTGLPMVIDLAQCEPSRRDWLGSILQGEHDLRKHVPLTRPGVCAHLDTLVSSAEVTAHLARQLLVLPVDKTGYRSGTPSLWRLFDPRVFANLCWMLDQDQQDALLGPISAWAFPWFDHWFTLERTLPWRPRTDDAPDAPPAHPKPVDMAVWERAQRIASINQVLARIAISSDCTWEQRVTVAQLIESALVTAKHRLHWHQSEDQMAYAEHVTRYGEAFLNHPKLSTYWSLREEGKASGNWPEVADRLTADDYQTLQTQHPITHGVVHHPAPPSQLS